MVDNISLFRAREISSEYFHNSAVNKISSYSRQTFSLRQRFSSLQKESSWMILLHELRRELSIVLSMVGQSFPVASYDNRRDSRYSYIPQWASFIHLFSYFLFSSFPEAECCVGEATGEACWEPCYCVLLQDEQTLTAYRSEDMAVSTLSPSILSAWSWKPSPIRPDQPIGFLPSLLCYANFLEIFADYNFFFLWR